MKTIGLDYVLPSNVNKIIILGSGISVDNYDWNRIWSENSLLICINNSVCNPAGRRPDIYVCVDVFSFRKELLPYLSKDTVIASRSNMTTFFSLVQKGSLDRKSGIEMKAVRSAVSGIVLYRSKEQYDRRITGKNVLSAAKDFVLYNVDSGSCSIAFSLALALVKANPNIKTVEYTGIDSTCLIQEGKKRSYPACYKGTPAQYSNELFVDYGKPVDSISFGQYMAPLEAIIDMAIMSKEYYNKLESVSSFINIKDIRYKRLMHMKASGLPTRRIAMAYKRYTTERAERHMATARVEKGVCS
jgi:hypothetical protein